MNANTFMTCVYAAIADGQIPVLAGFGNAVERQGSRYIDSVLEQYPVLMEYESGVRSTKNAFQRYVQATRNA